MKINWVNMVIMYLTAFAFYAALLALEVRPVLAGLSSGFGVGIGFGLLGINTIDKKDKKK